MKQGFSKGLKPIVGQLGNKFIRVGDSEVKIFEKALKDGNMEEITDQATLEKIKASMGWQV